VPVSERPASLDAKKKRVVHAEARRREEVALVESVGAASAAMMPEA